MWESLAGRPHGVWLQDVFTTSRAWGGCGGVHNRIDMFLTRQSNIKEGCQRFYFSLMLSVVEEVFMAVLEIAVPLFKIKTLEALVRIVARGWVVLATIIRE